AAGVRAQLETPDHVALGVAVVPVSWARRQLRMGLSRPKCAGATRDPRFLLDERAAAASTGSNAIERIILLPTGHAGGRPRRTSHQPRPDRALRAVADVPTVATATSFAALGVPGPMVAALAAGG